MTQAIVHIGTPKTGSTSAQKLLAGHRRLLRDNGILYPRSLGNSHHNKLATACRSANRPERGFRAFDIKTKREHARFRDSVWRDFEQELTEARAQGIDRVILSTEWFYDRLNRPAEQKELVRFLRNFFDDFKVIAWLRPQVDVVVSFASTVSRTGRVFNRDWVETKFLKSKKYDYNHYIRSWESATGAENFVTVPYKRQPDVTGQLLSRLGTDIGDQIPRQRLNEKLSVKVIAMGNSILLRDAVKPIDAGWNRRDYFSQMPTGDALRIGLDYAREIHARYAEGNAALVARRPELVAEDFEPDWSRHEGAENLSTLDTECQFTPELTQLVALMEARLKTQQARTEIALAGQALLREERSRAVSHGQRAAKFLNAAKNGCPEDATTFRQEVRAARAALDKLDLKG